MAGSEDVKRGWSTSEIRKKKILSKLQAMFAPKIDGDFVERVLVAYDWNLDKALNYLHVMVKGKEELTQNKKDSDVKGRGVNKGPDFQGKAAKPKNPQTQKPNVKPNIKDQTPKRPEGNNSPKQKFNFQGPKPGTSSTTQSNFQNIKVSYGGDINKSDADVIIESDEILQPQSANKSGAIPKVPGKNKIPSLLSYTPDKGLEKKIKRKQLVDTYRLIKQMKDPVDRIRAYINADIKVLVIMRGCPGSGKTTYARKLLSKFPGINPKYHIFSADNFFICESSGVYMFNPENIPKAHEWVQGIVLQALKERCNPVVVDNTNTRLWEMKPYGLMAIQYGYVIETLEPPITPWSSNPELLAKKNVHFVPRYVISKMLERYDADISGEDLITMLNLSYDPTQQPPQSALAPNTPPSKKLLNKMVLPKKVETKKMPESNIQDIVHDFFVNTKVDLFSKKENSTQNSNVSQNLIDLLDLDFSLINTNSSQKCATENNDNITIDTGFDSSSVNSESQDMTSEDNNMFEDIMNLPTPEQLSANTLKISNDNSTEYVLVNNDQTLVFQLDHEETQCPITLEQFQNTSKLKLESELVSAEGFPDEFNDFLSSWLQGVGVKNSDNNASTNEDTEKSKECTEKSYSDILCDWESNEKKTEEKPSIDGLPKDQRPKILEIHTEKDNVKDATTNTNYNDFQIMNKLMSGLPAPTEKIILGKPTFVSSHRSVPVNKSVFMLERGTMTRDIETNRIQELGSGLDCLTRMFPQIPSDDLAELFEKCGRDIDWTTGLLLDSGEQISEQFTALTLEDDVLEMTDNGLSAISKSEDTPLVIKPETDKKEEVSNVKHPKKTKKAEGGDLTEELKKHMENSFVINEGHYSDRILRVKNAHPRSGLVNESYKSDSFGSTEVDTGFPLPQDDSVLDTEEELPLSIGKSLIVSLQSRFGSLIPSDMIGDEVIADIPVGLARQFYSYVMDSVLKQVEKQELLYDEGQLNNEASDEMLAIQLQEEEYSVYEKTNSLTPNLREIMDKELALSIHKSQMKESSCNDNETIAGRLSKQLLIERFPNMDPKTLSNLFEDTDNSLHQTMVLLQSAGHSPKPLKPKISNEVDKHQFQSREEVLHQINAYKDVANKIYVLRNDFVDKARTAIRNGNPDIASYYTEMARWHMNQINEANLLATTQILTVKGQMNENASASANTIDLHFLHVSEAVEILDLFLDAHIRNMMMGSYPNKRPLYIITGRGAHSVNGKSRIRPAVQSRLTKRNIHFTFENPGLLKAFVTRKTALSSSE